MENQNPDERLMSSESKRWEVVQKLANAAGLGPEEIIGRDVDQLLELIEAKIQKLKGNDDQDHDYVEPSVEEAA